MARRFCIACSVLIVIAVAGCGIGKNIVAKQEWSENYALEDGVKATSPLMVDGKRHTVGETETPSGGSRGGRGATRYSEVIVELPEKKSIRRIDLYTDNIQDMSIYSGGRDEDIWVLLEEIKNNREKKLSLKVSTVTDKIKVRVRKTSDDKLLPGTRNRYSEQVQRAKGKIKEIEIYGLAEVQSEEEILDETEFVAADEGFTAAEEVDEAAEQVTALDTSSASIAPAKQTKVKTITEPKITTKVRKETASKPKAPAAAMRLESPQSTYALTGPVPAKISLKVGPDDLLVLKDYMSDEMLLTKLLVKAASGEEIPCSKPAPGLSRSRPYRASGGVVNVRNARTLEAGSLITVEIANLLECYPITEPGSYTVQFDMKLGVHTTFVGRNQTQIRDIERTMRDINGRGNYSQTEKATLLQSLREDIAKLEADKSNRYIVVGSRSKSLALKSNVLELTIQ